MPDYDHIERQLQRQEGFRDKPYWDGTGRQLVLSGPDGHATAAYGRNLNVPFTLEEGRILLRNDIRRAENLLDAHIPWWRTLSIPRQNVLLNMCFNMGWGDGKKGLSGFHETLAAIRAGRHSDVPAHMQASRWFGQVGNRAIELITQYREDRLV